MNKRMAFHFEVPGQRWLGAVGLGLGIGIAYFAAAHFGLTLRTKPEGIAIFWPAAGIAVGALVALGFSARLPVAAAVVVATTACNLMTGRNAWLAVAFGSINAGQALLTSWLLERWFGSWFKLEGVQRVLAFLVSGAIGSAFAAVGGSVGNGLLREEDPAAARGALLFLPQPGREQTQRRPPAGLPGGRPQGDHQVGSGGRQQPVRDPRSRRGVRAPRTEPDPERRGGAAEDVTASPPGGTASGETRS